MKARRFIQELVFAGLVAFSLGYLFWSLQRNDTLSRVGREPAQEHAPIHVPKPSRPAVEPSENSVTTLTLSCATSAPKTLITKATLVRLTTSDCGELRTALSGTNTANQYQIRFALMPMGKERLSNYFQILPGKNVIKLSIGEGARSKYTSLIIQKN